MCTCLILSFKNPDDLERLGNKRHHHACELFETEKHPRVFYYEEGVDAWIPAPEKIENIFSTDDLDNQEVCEVRFKRVDMTDKEYSELLED